MIVVRDIDVIEFLTHRWEDLVGRIEGPMSLRLLIQPIIAVIFAVRSGLRDTREGRPAFIWALVSDPDHRRDLMRQAWKVIGKVFLAAVILDGAYQIIVLNTFYPGEAVIVAALLALVPYVVVRALVTRLADRKGKQP